MSKVKEPKPKAQNVDDDKSVELMVPDKAEVKGIIKRLRLKDEYNDKIDMYTESIRQHDRLASALRSKLRNPLKALFLNKEKRARLSIEIYDVRLAAMSKEKVLNEYIRRKENWENEFTTYKSEADAMWDRVWAKAEEYEDDQMKGALNQFRKDESEGKIDELDRVYFYLTLKRLLADRSKAKEKIWV